MENQQTSSGTPYTAVKVSGGRCATCGEWVDANQFHFCKGYAVQIRADERIALALERIADALEKVAR